MPIPLEINGQTYDYPEVDDTDWGVDATDWAQAVTTGMLQKAGGLFQLLAEVDFGSSFGVKSLYYKSRTANVADAGQVRLARADVLNWRNQANSANLSLGVSASDALQFNGVDLQGAISVSDTATIDLTLAGSVLSADLVDMAEATIKGRAVGSGTGEPVDLSPAQATAILDTFTDSLKGLVPASGGGTTTFLRADGTWNTPIGAGDVVGPPSATDDAIAVYDGITGNLIKNSVAILTAGGNLSGIADLTVSGSTQLAAGLTGVVKAASGAITASSVVDADVSASAAIAFSKLAALTSANILVGNVSNVATSVAMSGAITIDNAGATTYNGTVPINKGGTGQTTQAAALAAILGSSYSFGSQQVFTSSNTWTRPSGCRAIKVFVQGAGGAGGGIAANDYRCGAGGSGGALAVAFLTSGFSATESITIGAGGTGGNGNGGSGGQSSFGSLVTADGGVGGTGNVDNTITAGTPGQTTTTGADYTVPGGAGGWAMASSTVGLTASGQGGNTQFGSGGASVVGNGSNGNAGTGYGAGGGGTCQSAATNARTGGDGAPGIIIVEEYY